MRNQKRKTEAPPGFEPGKTAEKRRRTTHRRLKLAGTVAQSRPVLHRASSGCSKCSKGSILRPDGLTVGEVAKALGVSGAVVRALCLGPLTAYQDKIRGLRVDPADLVSFRLKRA
jgi:hypothetical protein